MKHYYFISFILLIIVIYQPAPAQRKKRDSQTDNTLSFNENLYKGLEWRLVGPFRGGRSCAVTGVAGNPNLFYFGSTGGGVWKTENGGASLGKYL